MYFHVQQAKKPSQRLWFSLSNSAENGDVLPVCLLVVLLLAILLFLSQIDRTKAKFVEFVLKSGLMKRFNNSATPHEKKQQSNQNLHHNQFLIKKLEQLPSRPFEEETKSKEEDLPIRKEIEWNCLSDHKQWNAKNVFHILAKGWTESSERKGQSDGLWWK